MQSCRQMRRTRPRVPKTFLGPPPAAGLQQQPWRPFLKDGGKPPTRGTSEAAAMFPSPTQQKQPEEANAVCRYWRWAKYMHAAAEQNEDKAWPDQRPLFCCLPHEPSVSEDEVGSKCAGRILRATTLQPTVQLGDRGQPFALWCPA